MRHVVCLLLGRHGGERTNVMTESTHSCTVVLTNTAGLHLRAANLFVQLAVKFESRVEVSQRQPARRRQKHYEFADAGRDEWIRDAD